ncbi:ATP-binding protein [Streptosporangium subroseum]|uniref:ATP-binding protein n=1 Tax=Streptosporangium subroseum TaxID=106412 RepID=UPI003085E492|nr:ATP-binding protein [Streptosporangium subroseum]
MSAYGQVLCRYERRRVVSGRWAVLHPLGHAEFAGAPCSVATVRAWARGLLSGRVVEAVLGDVVLLLSEVVTNAVVHSDSGHRAGGSVTVCLGLGGGMVHVEVIDDGSAGSIPFVRAAEADSDGGRGLFLVEVMAADWGTHHDDEAGTAVWFHLPDGTTGHNRPL